MFLCGNCTTGEDDKKFETIVGTVGVDRSSKVLQHIMAQQTCETAVRQIMLCPSKYKLHLAECERTGKPFTDPDFPPNADSLNYASGREIAWKRISEIMPDFKMVEKGIVPADIQQGNIGDCYFLASLAALAEDPSRIVAIFHEDFEESKYGLYKVLVNREGVPTELVIDDYIPVYKTTNRPVFCKANGNEIWVMLLEKVWAKVKGSYGAIKAGSPHEVLNTFSIAPCFNFSIHEALEEADHDKAWESLREAARRNYPMCAGSNDHVGLAGLKPNHTYTLLHCEDVRSNNKSYRILRLRNPWGKTEYKGFASEYDEDFWADVPKEVQAKILPKKESNDGDFTIPIEAFVQNFESIDISHIRNAFSYEFKKLWMQSNQPTFVRLRVE
jgi:calpain-15